MGRPQNRNSRFGRGRKKNKPETSAHEANVATFPEPAPFPEKAATESNGSGTKPDFSDNMAVKFNRAERAVMRYALNNYMESLEKLSKQLRSRGLSNEEVKQRIALINGGDGLGSGIYNRLSEQMSIVDETQLTIQAEQRANEAEAMACTEALIGLTDMPIGKYGEQLLALVRTWPSNKRTEAIEYAVAVGAPPEGEKYQGEVPSQVRVVIDRAIEWTMTAEDIEQYVAAGPWRTAWLEDDAKKVFHFAELPPAVEGEAATQGDHGLFQTAPEARRCVARLNRQLAIEKNAHEPPPASE